MSRKNLGLSDQIAATLLGRRLVRLRGKKKQREIATLANMDQAQLSRYERGKSLPSRDILERLAGALGCTVQEIEEPLGADTASGLSWARSEPTLEGKKIAARLDAFWKEHQRKFQEATGHSIEKDSYLDILAKDLKIPFEILDDIFKGNRLPTRWIAEKLSGDLGFFIEDLVKDIDLPVSAAEWPNPSSLFDYNSLRAEIYEITHGYATKIMDKMIKLVQGQESLLKEIELLRQDNIELLKAYYSGSPPTDTKKN